MAGSLNARDDSDELEVNHEINVTPFIDVMLVLLIIFMVAAPLSTVDVHVDLPVSNAQPAPRPSEPIFLTVKADLSLAFGNDPIARGALKSALDAKSQGKLDERVFVRADKTVDFGDLMQVMNELRSAGYLKIALVGLETATPGAATTPSIPAATPDAAPQPSLPSAPPLPAGAP